MAKRRIKGHFFLACNVLHGILLRRYLEIRDMKHILLSTSELLLMKRSPLGRTLTAETLPSFTNEVGSSFA